MNKTTGQVKDGGAVKRGAARLAKEDKRRIGQAVIPDLLRRITVAGRMPEDGAALAVVVALLNLGAIAEYLAVSAKAIREQSGQPWKWSEDEIAWVCRNFISSGFSILEKSDPQLQHEHTGRFYLSTEAAEISNAADMMRVHAQHLLGKADLLDKAAFASKASVPMWMSDRGEKLISAAGLGKKADAA